MNYLGKLSFRGALALTTAAVAWGVPLQPVHAQSSGSNRIEEIVVTANKRKENIQLVPIAISAITASSAAKLGITDTQSLVAAVPGLTWTKQGIVATPFLRGVGTPVGQPGDEPAVAYYVDDVYMPSGGSSLSNFNNVEGIEVDKGPQGTILGRNATGGAVRVTTRDPSTSPSADLQLGYANYNTPSASMYVTGPLTSKISANLSAYWSKQFDGWGHDVCGTQYANVAAPATGGSLPPFPIGGPGHCSVTGDTGITRDYGGRTKILFQPDDDTSVLLNLDYDHTYTQEGIDLRGHAGTTTVGGYAPPANFYDTVNNVLPEITYEQYGAGLKVKHRFDWANLQSITSWRRLSIPDNLPNDAGPYLIIPTHLNTLEQTRQEDIQLTSPDGSALKWVAGLFYYHDYVKDPYYYYGQLFQTLYGNPYQIGQGEQTTDSYAGYGQAIATILPDTHLTVGLRYTMDRRQFSAAEYLPAPPTGVVGPFLPPIFPAGWSQESGSAVTKKWPKLTYRFILDHQFTPDIMGYIGYNRGFKSGVFNTTVSPYSAAPGYAQPETLDSYTIGGKSEFFGHRLRLNIEGFYYQYKNIQVDETLAASTILANAASATIKGVDLDVVAEPIEHLRVTSSIEFLNGHYSTFNNGVSNSYNGNALGGNSQCVPVGGVVCPNLAGNDTVDTPPFTFDMGLFYTIPSSYGPFNLSLLYSHAGNYYFEADNGHGQQNGSNGSYDKQPVLNLVNLSAGWTSENGRYNVTLWTKNLTGQQYYDYVSEDAFATQYSAAPPRTFGITLKLHLEPGTSPVAETTAAAAPVEIPAATPAPAPEAQRAFQVFFDFDKSNITSAAAETIQKAADEVNAGHLASINVTGHTDTVGSDAYNQKLSEKRAAAVKKQLQADGVSSSEIATVGVGKSGLLVPTPDGTREPQNRRAEIVLH